MNKALERALKRQREIADAAKAENRDLTEAETREFNELQAIIDDITADGENGGEGGARGAEPTPPAEPEDGGGTPTPEGERGQTGAGITPADAAAIVNMCRHFGMDAADFLSRGLTPEQVRTEIIARQMENQTPIGTNVHITDDERDKKSRAMTDGIILRGGGQIATPAPGANNYRAMSMKDITVECLEREHPGQDFRHMDTEKLLAAATREFYNPVSAFPSILDDVVQKSYVEGLNKARVSFDKWVKFGTLPNFKKTTNHEYIMSLGGELEKVPENGELKAYKPEDVPMPERKLETYGRQFTMSRQAFIDDDIGLLTTMPRRYGEMSKKTQNKAVYNLLLSKKKLYDGKTLFADERKNSLSAGTGITLDAIQKMIYMIGIQKDEAGNQLALVPDLFIVPFGMGVEVNKILNTPTFYSAEGTTINPYYNQNFTVVEDVTLNGLVKEGEPLPWFMGMVGEIIQVDYLNGQKEATIKRWEKPGVLGFGWDVYHDFGISVLHPQAICRNPGVPLNI